MVVATVVATAEVPQVVLEVVATAEVPQVVLEAVVPMGAKKAIRDLLVAATVAALANPGVAGADKRDGGPRISCDP